MGKERITKNTPIFEAQTSSQRALKHRLITLPDPLVSKIPLLSLHATSETVTNNIASFTAVPLVNDITFTFKQKLGTNGTIPVGLADMTYTILLNDRFLVCNGQALQTEPNTRIRSYSKVATGNQGSQLDVTVTRKTVDATTYTQFGNLNVITTVLTVIGDQSGLRNDVTIQLTKP